MHMICQNVKAKLCTTNMNDLPADRLEVEPPFTNTRIDKYLEAKQIDGDAFLFASTLVFRGHTLTRN